MARPLRQLLGALLTTVVAGLAFTVVRVPVPPDDGVVHVDAIGGDVATISLVDPSSAHRVTLTFGTRQAALVLSPAKPATSVQVPHLDGPVRLRVAPAPPAPLDVRIGVADADPGGITWTPTVIPTTLPEPRPRNPDTGVARAAIDETDTFGIRTFGVPLRSSPSVRAERVMTAFHGDVFTATCWTVGDTVDNDSSYYDRPGSYASDIWFRITTWSGERAYVPDTRFSRTGDGDRLDLPPCERTSAEGS